MHPETDEPAQDGFFDHYADTARYLAAPALIGIMHELREDQGPPPRDQQRVEC